VNEHSRRIRLPEDLEVGIQSPGHMAVHCKALDFARMVLPGWGTDLRVGQAVEALASSTVVVGSHIAAAADQDIHLAQAARHSALGTRQVPEIGIPCSAGALAGGAQGTMKTRQEAHQHRLRPGVMREAFGRYSRGSAQQT